MQQSGGQSSIIERITPSDGSDDGHSYAGIIVRGVLRGDSECGFFDGLEVPVSFCSGLVSLVSLRDWGLVLFPVCWDVCHVSLCDLFNFFHAV